MLSIITEEDLKTKRTVDMNSARKMQYVLSSVENSYDQATRNNSRDIDPMDLKGSNGNLLHMVVEEDEYLEVASEGELDFQKVRSPRENFLDEIVGELTGRNNKESDKL